MLEKKIVRSLVSIVLGMAVPLAAAAASGPPGLGLQIPLVNPSFEADPVPAPGGFSSNVTGWVTSTNLNKGTFRPDEVAYQVEIPDGINVAYINRGQDPLRQVTPEILELDATYTLLVEVGDRLDAAFAGYQISLEADGETVAVGTSSTPPDGGFVTSITQLTVPAEHAGKTLGIRLDSLLVGGTAQVNFDDVQLFKNPVDLIFADGFESGTLSAWSTPPMADFSFTDGGGAGFIVAFTDESLGNIDSWLWDFGDGTSGPQQNPFHVFGLPGTYQVTLTVGDRGLTDSTTRAVTVPLGEAGARRGR